MQSYGDWLPWKQVKDRNLSYFEDKLLVITVVSPILKIEICCQGRIHKILKICMTGFFFNSYNGNNVIVYKSVLLNTSCTVGDHSGYVQDRPCVRKIGSRFYRA